MSEMDEIPDLDVMERGLVVIGTMGTFLTAYATARGVVSAAQDFTTIIENAAKAASNPAEAVLSILGKGRKGGLL